MEMTLVIWGQNKMAAILPDDIFKLILLFDDYCTLIAISLKFVLVGPINNKSVLIQALAWRWTGDKPLSELAMAIVYWRIYIYIYIVYMAEVVSFLPRECSAQC